MKNIRFYDAEKYQNQAYEKVDEHIYKTIGTFMKEVCYVTSLIFEQEPEFGEGESSSDISQYPLEDILDRYYVAVEDFYTELNDGSSNECILEFCSLEKSDIEKLREIVGKHVYLKDVEKDGATYEVLTIE